MTEHQGTQPTIARTSSTSPSIQELVDQYLKDTIATPSPTTQSTSTIIHQLKSLVQRDPHKNLLSIIQATQPSLTSQSDPTRTHGIRLLVQLIDSVINLNILSNDQVHHLIEFFLEKLTDQASIVHEALNALSSLTSSNHFRDQDAIKCCQALFSHIPTHDLDQPKRLAVLILIDRLMAYFRHALKSMGDDFLIGYCSLAEGEKDPRNLVIAFRLVKVILTEFDLGDQVQNFFDITFCYFPITFRPPSGNPDAYGGITADELTQGLIDCLSSTPRLGIFVLPLLLDKFQAPASATKAQVLQTVIQAFPTYGQAAVAEFAHLFWESFLVEVFQPNTSPTKEFQKLLARAIQTLFRTVFPSVVDFSPSGPTDFVKHALEVVSKELHSPEKSRAIPATWLLCWIIESRANRTDVILPTVLTSLTTLVQLWRAIRPTSDYDISTRRISILSHIRTIFGSIEVVASDQVNPIQFSSANPLIASLRNDIFGVLMANILKHDQYADSMSQVAALRTLARFVGVPGVLGPTEAQDVIRTVTHLLVNNDEEDEITNAAIDSLATLVESHPTDVVSITLSELFQHLPGANSSPSVECAAIPAITPARYTKILEGLATLCDRPPLFDPFLVHLLNALEFSLGAAFQTSVNTFLLGESISEERFDYYTYSHHLLLCLHTVINSTNDSPKSQLSLPTFDADQRALVSAQVLCITGRLFEILLCEDRVLEHSSILERAAEKFLSNDRIVNASTTLEHCSIRHDMRLMGDVGRIMNLLVRQLDFKRQQSFVTKLHAGYYLGNIDDLIAESRILFPSTLIPRSSKVAINFMPMSANAPDREKNMLILYSAVIVALHPGIVVPCETLSITEFFVFKHYYHLSKTSSLNLAVFQASLRLLCSTVNRRAEDFPEFFGEQLDHFWNTEISLGSFNSSRTKRLALEMWLWIAKGLVVRSNSRGYELLDRVCELLKDESELGWWTAKRLSVIVDTKDDTLSSKNFAIHKFLWMQRVCHYLISRLVRDYNDSTGPLAPYRQVRSICLVGLATLLSRVDSPIVSLQHEKVVPMLLEALKLHDAEAKLDSLTTLHELVINDKLGVTFEKHLSSLILALLPNCTLKKPNSDLHGNESKTSTGPVPLLPVPSAAVRLSALKILSILPEKVGHTTSSPTDREDTREEGNVAKGILFSNRSKVLQTLTLALDDPKREVRKVAVDCRSRWFSLDLF